MSRLVNDLLTLARSDDTAQQLRSYGYKKSKWQVLKVDLDSLLLEVFRQYKPTDEGGNRRQQGPRLMLQDITRATVHGEAHQLKQVLVALLDNALKYTPSEDAVTLSLLSDDYSEAIAWT